MNDKIKDFKLLLQNDRRVWACGGFILLGILLFSLTATPKKKEGGLKWSASPGQMEQASDQGMGKLEAYKDLIQAFQDDMKGLRKDSKDSKQVITRLATNLDEHKERSAGIFDSLLDKLEQFGREIERLEEKTNNPTAGGAMNADGQGGGMPGGMPMEQDSLESFAFNEATVPPPPPPPERPVRISFISPGDSVPIKLLTGVAAPVDGTPYPVVFKLDGPITGPDGAHLDLGGARLIAAAQGSETDARVLFRLTDLAIRHNDGRRSIIKIDGWVVGEDGVRGMRGKLIDKLGRLIAATAGYSFAAALGERIDDQADDIDVENSGDGDINVSGADLNVATASAITDASNRIGQILLDRYEKLVPVVEILSGRTVAAVFSQPAEVSIIDEDLDGEGIYSASLD